MKVIKYENVVAFDCDDTLALWDDPNNKGIGKIDVQFAGKVVYLTPHTYHIDLMKMYKERGYYVIVWSANGWQHAERICKALKIEDFVDVVQCKLSKHVDDSDNAAAILGARVFCEDLTKPTYTFLPIPPSGTIILDGGSSVSSGQVWKNY